MKILVVEDDNFSRRIIEAQLEKRGHIVLSCRGGREALAVLEREFGIELAVVNWLMPDMDGLELCRAIKADGLRPFVYVIILTAKRSPKDVTVALDSGADDFISKPYDDLEFDARIAVGERTRRLRLAMAEHILELEQAAAQIERLNRMLPICAYCGATRRDASYIDEIRSYVEDRENIGARETVCTCRQESGMAQDATL